MVRPLSGSFLDNGDLELKEILGRGGMGVVYRGRQVSLDRVVAIKLLLLEKVPESERQDAANRLHDEAQAAARIRHKNLVEIISLGVDDKMGPYIVYEFLPGGTLKAKVEKDGPMEWKTFYRHVGRGLLQALGELHKVGIIHRDVKPENVLASEDGSYKLGDLGLALFQGRSANTLAGTLYGTPGYLAPERVSEHSEVLGSGSDLYSAAVLMVESVTGSLPFHGRSSVEIISDQLKRKVDKRALAGRGLPKEVSRVLARALSRNPRRRPKTAAEFIKQLDEATFSKAKSTTKQAITKKVQKSNNILVILAILLVMCTIGGLHHFLRKGSRTVKRLGPEFQKLRQKAIAGSVAPQTIGSMVLESELATRLKLVETTKADTAGLLYLARFCQDKKIFDKALTFYGRLAKNEQRPLPFAKILAAMTFCANKGNEWKEFSRILPTLHSGKLSAEEGDLLRLRMAQAIIEQYISETHRQRDKRGRAKAGVSVETLQEALLMLRRGKHAKEEKLALELQLTALAFQTGDNDKEELIKLTKEVLKNEGLPLVQVNELLRRAVFILNYAYMPAEEDMMRNIAWLDELLERNKDPDEKAQLLACKSAVLIKSLTDLGRPTPQRGAKALQAAQEALKLSQKVNVRAYALATKAWILARSSRYEEAWRTFRKINKKDIEAKQLWWYLRVKGGLESYDQDYQKAMATHRQALECAPPELTHYIRLVHAGSVASSAGFIVPGQ